MHLWEPKKTARTHKRFFHVSSLRTLETEALRLRVNTNAKALCGFRQEPAALRPSADVCAESIDFDENGRILNHCLSDITFQETLLAIPRTFPKLWKHFRI